MKTNLSQNPTLSNSLNFSTPKPTEHQIIMAYGPKLKVSITFAPGFGRTKQSFKDESDINNIMAKYQKTGTLDYTNKTAARYADVIGHDFTTAMLVVAQGKSMFQELPSSVRARFDNDPAKFLDFFEDRRNLEEAREMGLVPPAEPEATPLPTPAAGAAGAAPAASSGQTPSATP